MEAFPDLLAALKDASPYLLLVFVVLAFIWLFDRFSNRMLALLERIASGRKR